LGRGAPHHCIREFDGEDNFVPGDTEDQGSYRSELSGLYCTGVIHALCEFYKIDQGTIEVGCDGITSLERGFDETQYPSNAAQHFDLILAIRNIRASCPIHWKHRHVKGHQDDSSSVFLDRWALLNIDMDLAAKLHWHRHAGGQSRHVWKNSRGTVVALLDWPEKVMSPKSIGSPRTVSAKRLVPTSIGRHAVRPWHRPA
jgi:hypothetical protein